MSRRRFILWNGAMPTTAAMPSVATGTAIKTMLQFKPTSQTAIIGWGYIHDTVPTAAVTAELLTTGTVAATGITAYGANDLIKYDDSGGANSGIVTASVSGFTATGEGSITATRPLDVGPSWSPSYAMQFPLDREPGIITADVCRIRMTTTVTIFTRCFVIIEE